MITKINLKNWRSHLDSEIKFSDGTNCFIGAMGSGKTSVMDAICFALFGTFPQLQQKKVKLEDVVMKKPYVKDNAEVELFFNLNGDEWSVKRMIQKGRATAELKKNGKLIESPQTTRVTEEVERLLKIDYDLFTRAIYSEQNQLDHFLTIPKGQRMKKIDQLLAIDKFEKARASTRSLINKSKVVINEKKQLLENLKLDESVRNLERFKNELRDLGKQRLDFEKQLSKAIDRKKIVENNIINLRSQEKQLQRITEEIKTTKALSKEIENDIEGIKDNLVELAEKTTAELKQELSRLTDEYGDIKVNLDSERKEMDELRDDYSKKEAHINLIESEQILKLKDSLKDKTRIFTRLRKNPVKVVERKLGIRTLKLQKNQVELQSNEVKISELDTGIKELRKVRSICPVCDTELTGKKKKGILRHRRKEIKKFKEKNKKIKIEINKLEKEINKLGKQFEISKDLQKQLDEIKESEKELKDLERVVKIAKEEVKDFLREKSMLSKNIKLLENRSEYLFKQQEKIKNLIERRENVEIKIQKSKLLTRQLVSLNRQREILSSFSPEVLKNLESEFQTLIGMEKQIETRIESLDNLKQEKQKFIQEIESKLKQLQQYETDIRKIENISIQLRLFESALVSTQEQLRKNFVVAVNHAMNSIWEEMYPYGDLYSIRLGIEGGDYVLQLQDSTGWINADGVASGGERSLACLALRIAFSIVLAPQLRWLVLDEPTHNLDRSAVEELATVLRERIPTMVDQVFLITHDPNLETAVSGFLYRLERKKEKDDYTRVIPVIGPED